MPAAVSATLTVTVRCFAQLRDRLGRSECSITLPAGATGRHLIHVLEARHPDAAPLLGVSRLAVNWEYVVGDVALGDGDEVAVIPPVSGG